MANSSTQSYASHAHRPTLTTVAGLFTMVALVLAIKLLLRDLTSEHVAMTLLALGVFTLVLISRAYTVRLQDRVIRLEMQVRLARLGREMSKLSIKQITALRFASDAELAALLDRTIAENLTPDQIKKAVTEWQPDLMRT